MSKISGGAKTGVNSDGAIRFPSASCSSRKLRLRELPKSATTVV